jgi:hypothetical protein
MPKCIVLNTEVVEELLKHVFVIRVVFRNKREDIADRTNSTSEANLFKIVPWKYFANFVKASVDIILVLLAERSGCLVEVLFADHEK